MMKVKERVEEVMLDLMECSDSLREQHGDFIMTSYAETVGRLALDVQIALERYLNTVAQMNAALSAHVEAETRRAREGN